MYATPKALFDAFRREVRDTIAPYFWSETEVYDYMTDAESMVAQRILCIQDMTSEAAVYDITASEPEVVLHESVIRIRDATLISADTDHPLDILSADNMQDFGLRAIRTTTGRPNTLFTGATTNGVRLYPIPSTDAQLALSIYRTPLNPLTVSASFEVPKQYRSAMLEWMKYRAYNKDDVESYDPAKANTAMNAFLKLIDGFETMESMRRGGPQSGLIAYGGL